MGDSRSVTRAAGPQDDFESLVRAAASAPPAERVELYRDRLAQCGSSIVDPLLQLERDQPRLGLFVVTVLEAAAKRGETVAERAIRLLITDAARTETRASAADAIGRVRATGRLTAPSRRSYEGVVDVINDARRRRGEPILDAAELRKVRQNLARRERDPSHYRNVCWNCVAAVDEGTNEHCGDCGWLVCWCGGCRAPSFTDRRTGQRGPCRREVWLLARRMGERSIDTDQDFRGSPILTSQKPAQDAREIAAALRSHGVEAVYHWTPLRGVASILQSGILARRQLADSGIPFVGHGYGGRDKEAVLFDYVSLSFAPKPWMMSEWSDDPVLLELELDVLVGDGTLFVPGNSASATFSARSLTSMTGASAAEGLFLAGQLAAQAEAWVYSSVPRVGIRAIHVADDVLGRLATRNIEADLMRPIVVSPGFFLSPEPEWTRASR